MLKTCRENAREDSTFQTSTLSQLSSDLSLGSGQGLNHREVVVAVAVRFTHSGENWGEKWAPVERVRLGDLLPVPCARLQTSSCSGSRVGRLGMHCFEGECIQA